MVLENSGRDNLFNVSACLKVCVIYIYIDVYYLITLVLGGGDKNKAN